MIVETTKSVFEKFSKCFLELYPKTKIELLSCDETLERLGFCQSAPCSFKLYLSDDEYLMILDELMQMEVDAYNTSDGENPPESDPLYQRYLKYGWMWDILFYAKDEEND